MGIAFQYYKLTITDFRRNASSSVTYASIAELYLYDKEGNDVATASGAVYTEDSVMDNNSSYNAAKAFDRNTNTMWHSDHDNTVPYTHWIQVQFPEAKAVKSIGITPRKDYALDVPYGFYVEGSNDGVTWYNLLTVTDESTGWAMGTNRVFNLSLEQYESKYLIKKDDTFYTFENDVFTALTEIEVNADLFINKGFNDINLINLSVIEGLNYVFEILTFNETSCHGIEATATAVPDVPQVVESNNAVFNDSIVGIENIEVVASDTVLFQFSTDNGASWKAYDATLLQWVTVDTGGMNVNEITALTVTEWSKLVAVDRQIKIRFFLNAAENVTSIVINYTNE